MENRRMKIKAHLVALAIAVSGIATASQAQITVVPPGEVREVRSHGAGNHCRRIGNWNNAPLAVPHSMVQEWITGGVSFIERTPGGVSVGPCDPCGVDAMLHHGLGLCIRLHDNFWPHDGRTSWHDHSSACASIGPGWRLPWDHELLAIHNHRHSIPNLVFGCSAWPVQRIYWGQQLVSGNASVIWPGDACMSLAGRIFRFPVTRQFDARCVRNP